MIKRIQKLLGRYAMANLSLLSAISLNKRLTSLFILLFLGTGNLLAQGVSLTFSNGYVGTQNSAVQSTSSIKNLSSIGISRVSFSQTYSGAFGGTQGNDLSGTIKLYLSSGSIITLSGALNWRETSGSTVEVYGFIFNPGQNASIAYGNNQIYNIVGGSTSGSSTSLGLKAYSSSIVLTDGESRNGNAATSGLLAALNTELTSSPQPSAISLTNTSVIEGQSLVYTVTLSSATTANRPQVYTFSTSGPATKGADYSATYTFNNGVINNGDGTITVPGGVSSFTVTVSTIDDSLVESIENLFLTVGSKIGVGSIADNDNVTAANCDPNSLYDNIVSGYHQSIAKKNDGTFAVWGGLMANDGSGSRLSPTTINATNYPNLVGTPLKAAVAGEASSSKSQAVLLSTDGLYAWGAEGYLLDGGLTSSTTFAKIATPTGGDANTKLPTGVAPGSVKMMVAFYKALVLVTNSGNVWVLSTNTAGEIRGVGSSAAAVTTWSKVKIDASTDLTNVISVRGMIDNDPLYNGLMALTADGKAYVWGKSVYLADGAGSVSKSYATQMVLPAEFNETNLPKMIAVTGGNKTSITTCKNTFYILSNGGNLYAVGDNQKRQIGDFSLTERKVWTRVKINSTTDFTNINYISAMESDPSDPAVVAITKAGVLYTWGFNPRKMIGRPTADTSYDPGIPAGFTQGTDKAIFAEMGGHTLVYIKEGSTQFCYVGHRVDGSMGDGTNTDADEVAFNCSGTPSLAVCGSVPVAASTTTSTITANPTSIGANGITTSTITVQLKQANGTNLTSTGGTVVITTNKGTISDVIDNNDGTYTAILTSSSFVETATLNFTLNGANGTNNASVNFTLVTNPVLTATGTLKTFTSCSGCTVTPQSFSVSGVDLATNNLVVTAPTGFQVSTTPTSGFATSINIVPTSGTVTTTTVYAKLTNNATVVADGVISVTSTGAAAKTITVTTNTDNALNFDGSSDYVSLPSTLGGAYNNSTVTIEAWIKTSASSSLSRKDIITFGNTSLSNNVVEFRMSEGKLQFILNDGVVFYALTSTSFINTGKWLHVAVVKSGTAVNLYINGQVTATTASGNVSSSPAVNTARLGVLGYNTGTSFNLLSDSYFAGEIDQLRVWNTARTSSDIAANMFVEMSGNETGLVASYDFNQGTANGTNSITTVNDNSSNAYNGTLTSFALTGTTSNFVAGFIPEISAAGNATTLATGSTLQFSNGLTGGVWSTSNASFATVNASTGLVTSVANGTVSISYTICDKTVSYALTIVTPTITTSGTLKTFTSCSGCNITPQTFTASGTNLGSNLLVAAPAGFEIATTSGGTYSSTISLVPSSGTAASSTIYARLINNASSAVAGNFTITSSGATTRTVAATVNTDNALMLDGAGDYVNLGDVLDNTNLANTTEAWVYWKGSTEAFSEIFTKDVVQSFSITSGNKLHANFGDGSSWISGLNSTTSVPINTWTHLAVTRSGTGVVKMYINGVLDASTNTMNVTGNNTALRSIGGKNVSGTMNGLFTGAIDNLTVWNVEKTASEISNGMHVELAGNETDLLAYYDFNQGIARGTNTSITSLLDKGPSALNGTITGVTLTGSTSNFVDGSIPNITAAGNATNILAGGTLALSNGLTGGVWSSSNTNIATINPSTGVVTGVSAGNTIIRYTVCSKVVAYGVTVLVPTLTTGTLKTFSSCSGCSIPPQSFTVAGTNLGASAIITAPAGFEISNASAGTYSATLTLAPTSGTLATTNVYVRLINSATTATSGNFTAASTGAVSKTVTATVNTDNALSFDGVNDFVDIPDNNALDLLTAFTIEAWVKPATNTGSQVIIGKIQDVNSGQSADLAYGLRYNAGVLRSEIGNGTTAQSIQTNNLVANKWQHIAMVYDGSNSGNLSLYIDGVQQGSTLATGYSSLKNVSTSLKLGSYGTYFPQYYNGLLDNVKIWNVTKTQAEITAGMHTELNGDETGLVAYYNFNQGVAGGSNTSITTLNGRTSTPYNGTLTNFAKTGSASNFVTGTIPEIAGESILNKGLTTTYTNGLTGGTWASAATNIATVNATTGVVTGVNPGTSTITYTICEKTVSKVVTVVVSTITKSGTLTPFTTCLGTASDAQTFTVSAQYLTANLVLTAPAGYELATSSAGTYSTTLSIVPTSGAVSARSIYVRLSTSSVNGQSGNIVITSTGAVSQSIVTGNAVVTRAVVASVAISSNATNNSICSGTNVVFTATPTNGGSTPTYQWKLNGNNITGANSATYSTTTLATNDVITVVMSSSLISCISGTPATSNAITTTVTSIPATPGSISGQSVICMNSNQVYSIAAVPGATSYTWVVDGNLTATTSSTNVINITAANTANGSGTIKVLANNACGSSIYSAVFSVTISTQPAPTASFTVSANTVCLTNAGITFTNASTPNATTNSAIGTYAWTFGDGATASTASASNTYTSSGSFDAVLTITDGNQCTSSFANRITVDPASVAGSASVVNSTVCEGSSTVLTLSGQTGAIQWQQSTDGINFTNINGATTAAYNTGNLTVTTYYQAVATSGLCSAATSGVITVTVSPTPAVTLASLASINTTATSFDLTYSNPVGTPDEYSITAVGPNAMPNFVAISNYGLTASPITVSIPASIPGVYNFNLLVKNGSLGCVSSVIPFTQTISASSSTITVTGLTTYTYNGSGQGPATNTKTGSTGAVTYSYSGTGSTTYGPSATLPTGVGTYEVIATLAADANYSGATSAPYAFTITQASSTITVTGLTTYTQNGSAQGPATNTKTGSTGAVTYSYAGTGSTTYGPSATKPTGAGTYEVIATLAADANYSGATSAPYAFTITGTINVDSDGDGVTDAQELLDGTDPNNGCSILVASRTLTPTAAWNSLDCDNDGNPNATDPNKDSPVASDDVVTLPASGTVTINILVNDDFLAGVNIEITRLPAPNEGTAKGTVTFDGLFGLMSYKRAPFETGTVTVGYKVTNKGVNPEVSATAFVTIVACDLQDPLADCDGDGDPNGTDKAPTDPCVYSTTLQVIANVSDDWKALDCDGDGVLNGTELTDGTSPSDACSFKAGSITLAPSAAWLALDCDSDGVTNQVEGTKDFDGDGIPNSLDTDSDGDGISDKLETTVDTDKDGKPDYLDLDSDNDGILDSVENKVCTGTGILCDTDADGTPNFRDLDSDGDQIKDVNEANGTDLNKDGIADGLIDEKGIPASANKGLNPPDTDKDVKQDPYDVDSDGDGISDTDEELNEDGDFPDCDGDGIINRLDPDECDTFAPQGISPNGDGKNDRLVFKGLVLRKLPNHLSVYNRWGTLVFEMDDYDNSWSGTILPDGTYFYVLDFYGRKPTISNYLAIDRTIK